MSEKKSFFRIYYNVHGVKFEYCTHSVSDAFEAIKAIISRESSVAFPNKEEAFCNYFEILSQIAYGSLTMHENHIFRIEGEK